MKYCNITRDNSISPDKKQRETDMCTVVVHVHDVVLLLTMVNVESIYLFIAS